MSSVKKKKASLLVRTKGDKNSGLQCLINWTECPMDVFMVTVQNYCNNFPYAIIFLYYTLRFKCNNQTKFDIHKSTILYIPVHFILRPLLRAQVIMFYITYKKKGKGKVIDPVTGPVWPRGWVEV